MAKKFAEKKRRDRLPDCSPFAQKLPHDPTGKLADALGLFQRPGTF
jgi:hypothetical protein